MRSAAICAVILAAFAASGAEARADAPAVADSLARIRAALPPCDGTRGHCIGLHLHVTQAAGDAGVIASPDWLATQLATANRHFAPIDVGFQLAAIDTLPASAAHIANRRDRNNLATDRLHGTVIHVFVISQLDDVDAIGETRFGVAWHVPGTTRKYVILSTAGLDRVLAHELGHVFGLPHSTYPISIMNKTERKEPPVEQRTFADPELARMREGLRDLLRDHVIADMPAAASAAPPK
ncbi:MAG TPA: matrixin family metalloprotease [Kofleriaceae bacterium]|nr:matrixin family metalloprotease [Kofleriaceae bacterium]